jgi:hypothetical protein
MSTTDPPRPWRGLPDELKVKILEYALEIDKRTDLFEMSSLEPLLLTSKRMGDLALETWGKSKFEVWLPSSRMRMQYIDPEFGKHVRKLSLTIFLPDHLVWHDADLDTKCAPYMLVPYEIRGHRDTPWRVLLSCKSDGRLPLSEWQAALPNLKELYLHLRIQNRRPGSLRSWGGLRGNLHEQDIEGFLAKASCTLRADRVSVKIYDACCGARCGDRGEPSSTECPDRCAERLAMGVKALIEQNKL